MKKFFLVALMAVVAGGCVGVPVGGGGYEIVVPYQVGAFVRVVNNCAPILSLESLNGIEIKELPYGNSTTVPLISAPLSGRHRRLYLTAKGYTADRVYLGSATRTFHVSTYTGSRSDVWEVDRLHLPGGRGGCM